MKFAHIRVSEYFTFAKQIFHSEAISLGRCQISLAEGEFRWKKGHLTASSTIRKSSDLNPYIKRQAFYVYHLKLPIVTSNAKGTADAVPFALARVDKKDANLLGLNMLF